MEAAKHVIRLTKYLTKLGHNGHQYESLIGDFLRYSIPHYNPHTLLWSIFVEDRRGLLINTKSEGADIMATGQLSLQSC